MKALITTLLLVIFFCLGVLTERTRNAKQWNDNVIEWDKVTKLVHYNDSLICTLSNEVWICKDFNTKVERWVGNNYEIIGTKVK